MNKKRLRQQGMTLLELIVAMLIIGIALAGSVAMIQMANRFGMSAEFQSIAQWQSQNMMDRMRANSFAREAYVFGDSNWNIVDTRNFQYGSEKFKELYDGVKDTLNSEAATAVTCANSSACLPQEIATMDRAFWLRQLAQELPQGLGLIVRVQEEGKPNKAMPGAYAVIIMWRTAAPSEDAQASQDPQVHGVLIPFSI